MFDLLFHLETTAPKCVKFGKMWVLGNVIGEVT